ncbi:MAG: tetratricopeptide repeat protein [Deltaproteobacteria bacterium]|nr:tetratricopeptide repeat protein [Deltaproteobacteria bacterium]
MSQAPEHRARARKSLPVVDPAQDRVDGRTLHQAQRLIDEGKLDDAFRLLGPLTSEPSTSIRAHATLLAAALLSRRGQPALVIELLGRIPEPSADGRAAVVVDRGFFLLLRAQAARQLRHTDLALRDAQEACTLGETPARLLVLADCLRASGDVDGAVTVLKKARALDPVNVAVLGQLCGVLAIAGDDSGSDEVFAAFSAVKTEASDDADRHRNAAFALVCRGDFQEAVDAARLAVDLEPAITRAWLDDDDDMAPIRRDPRLL